MKIKMFAILIAVLFIVSMIPLALAQDNGSNNSEVGVQEVDIQDNFSEVEIEEVEVMHNPEGQIQRFTQLNESIQKSILIGQEALNTFENVSEEDLVTFNRVLSDLNALVVVINEVDYNSSFEELAKTYVGVRREAVSLVKEFRNLSKNYISEEKANQLRKQLRERNKEKIKEMKEKIQQKVRETYASNAKRFMEKFGVEDEALIQRYLNGEITNNEFRHQLKEIVKNFSKENKEKVFEGIKNERAQFKKRIKNVEAHKAELKQKLEERKGKIKSKVDEHLKKHRENMKEHREKNKMNNNSKETNGDGE